MTIFFSLFLELNLCIDGKMEMTAVHAAPLHGEPEIIRYISEEHSYSSPTKQEPHERSSVQIKGQSSKGQSARGKGKVAPSTRGKSRSLLGKSGKLLSKPVHTYSKKDDGDDHMSLSQSVENKLEFNDGILKVNCLPRPLGSALEQEKISDKVEKWLNNSSEIGFRIGVHHSSESSSVNDSESTPTFQVNCDQKGKKPLASLSVKACDGNSQNSRELLDNTTDASSHSGQKGAPTAHRNEHKFFKSRMKKDTDEMGKGVGEVESHKLDDDDIATIIYEPEKSFRGTPDDPFKFIPSQKTPKQKTQPKRGRGGAKSKARGTLLASKGKTRGPLLASKGRTRGRGRGTGNRVNSELTVCNGSVAEFGLVTSNISHTQSTPAVKGKPTFGNIDISIIKANDITVQRGPRESCIAYERDDDDDSTIPDSCPVNTKDEFDEIVADVKEKSIHVEKTATENHEDEEKEEQLLFVTPAQAVETPEIDGKATQKANETAVLVKGTQNGTKGINNESKLVNQNKNKQESTKRNKLSKSKSSAVSQNSSRSSSSSKSNTSLRKPNPVKAKVDIDAICALFDEVDDHELTTVTLEEDEKQKKQLEKEKEDSLRQDISLLNQTMENTELNKTVSDVSIKSDIMPPPKASARSKKVKFVPGTTKVHSVSGVNEEKVSSLSKAVSSRSQKSSPRVLANARATKSNVRYGSELKQKILEPNKVQAASVKIKDTKSPGWSHVKGARQDLKTRHTSLNITGGEHRNVSDSRTESGILDHSSLIPSSSETNIVIDDETQENNSKQLKLSQECDVEHLQSSQSKVELVKKLKNIVKQLKGVDDDKSTFSEVCENEIPESVREQVLHQDKESSIQEKHGHQEGSSGQESHEQQEEGSRHEKHDAEVDDKGGTANPESRLNACVPKYPTETEPFETSDIVNDHSLVKTTSEIKRGLSISKKRKADTLMHAADGVGVKTTQLRPTKLARKTFSLSSDKENTVVQGESKSFESAHLEDSAVSKDLKSANSTSQISADKTDAILEKFELQSDATSSVGENVKHTIVGLQESSSPTEKTRFPHHTMSPSMASTSVPLESCYESVGLEDGNGSVSRVIPFRSVGALCSKRFVFYQNFLFIVKC